MIADPPVFMLLQLTLNAGLKSHNEVFVVLGDLIDICAVRPPLLRLPPMSFASLLAAVTNLLVHFAVPGLPP